MSRDPENQETLTDEESDWLQRFRHYPWPDVSKSSADAGLDAGQVLAKLLRIHDAQAALVAAARECERLYSLHSPWPIAEELRLALIKDCPHTKRLEFAGGEWQCERCGATGARP